jgi:hypothetical protein
MSIAGIAAGGTAACFAVIGLAGSVNEVLASRTMYVIAVGFIGLMAMGFVREVRLAESFCGLCTASPTEPTAVLDICICTQKSVVENPTLSTVSRPVCRNFRPKIMHFRGFHVIAESFR